MPLINPDDMAAASLAESQVVGLASEARDGVNRQISGFAEPAHTALDDDEQSRTPAAKGVRVRIAT